ncbi:hypothetical protein H8A99_27855 [Bradyrhizobium sp. Arg68]|nr:hypothetical protein [Bradyrhizobium ivorense]
MVAAIFSTCWMCQPCTGLVRSDHQNWRRLRWIMRGSGRSQSGRKEEAGMMMRRSLASGANNGRSQSGTSR